MKEKNIGSDFDEFLKEEGILEETQKVGEERITVPIHKQFKKIDIGLIEYGVFNFPEGLEGWRLYRIEYGGHAESCVYEGTIWLPPHVDSTEFEKYLMKLQES